MFVFHSQNYVFFFFSVELPHSGIQEPTEDMSNEARKIHKQSVELYFMPVDICRTPSSCIVSSHRYLVWLAHELSHWPSQWFPRSSSHHFGTSSQPSLGTPSSDHMVSCTCNKGHRYERSDRTLLVAPGISTSSKKLLVARCIATNGARTLERSASFMNNTPSWNTDLVLSSKV